MPTPIKPVGSQPVFVWSDLLNPAYVTKASLPAKAGIYVLVACDSQGNPEKQKNEPANSLLSGVVYIGMTGSSNTLKNRVYALAKAWRTRDKPKTLSHGSRTHYNKDTAAQKAFKDEDVRIRYMALPTSNSQEA